jgi:hypothetical protein
LPAFPFCDDQDQELFETLIRREFNINGVQSKNLRRRGLGSNAPAVCAFVAAALPSADNLAMADAYMRVQ